MFILVRPRLIDRKIHLAQEPITCLARTFKAGVHVKTVLTSLNTAFLPPISVRWPNTVLARAFADAI